MKRVISLILLIFTILSVSSCSSIMDNVNTLFDSEWIESKKEYDALMAQKKSLEKELASLETEHTNYTIQINNIKKRLSEIDNEISECYLLFHELENEILKGAVLITHFSCTESGWGILSKEEYISGGLGSGFIIKETSSCYYILTNNHVIESAEGSDKEYLYVYDYNLNEYNGTLLFSSEDYDMAVISIDKNNSSKLKVMSLANEDPKEMDTVIAIGQPEGQVNSITIGCVNSYVRVSDVSYPVIHHDAYINNGSSGGMLINLNFEVVGINTWGLKSNTYEEHVGLSSPVKKIIEFLNLNSFTL